MKLPNGQSERLRELWDKLAHGVFVQPELRSLEVHGLNFQCLSLPRAPDKDPRVYIESGLSFLVWPRLAGYRYRWVLVPRDWFGGKARWEIRVSDVREWIAWANQMNHVVTFSTFKSGAGVPWSVHAQSVPLWLDDKTKLTVLDDVSERIMVPFRTMPFFHHVQIGIVEDHPARGIVLTGSQDSDGAHQVAQKAFELALNHDHLKTFNLVIVPTVEYSARVFFFPRRRDGIAVFGPNRWQVSAMELCGMIPAKCQDEFDSLNEAVVRQMFATTCPGDKEFADFTGLIETF